MLLKKETSTAWFTSACLFLTIVVSCGVAAAFSISAPKVSEVALFIVCDVGQGDAILLQVGSWQMLVDAGQTPQVLDCLDQFMPKNDRVLELVVATHADSDHIQGFESVFAEYFVGEIWLVSLSKKTAEFDSFMQSVSRKKEQGTPVRMVSQGDSFVVLGLFPVYVLSPQVSPGVQSLEKPGVAETILSDSPEELNESEEWGNDRSIVLKTVVYGVSILLTGDMEKSAEQAVVTRGLIDDIDILKVAHHGSKTSSTMAFLDKAQPEIAAVSSGQNNKYGHPSPEVIANLLQKRTKILRTDQLSHIVLEISKGRKVKMREKR